MTDTHEPSTEFTPSGRLHLGVGLIGPPSELDFNELRTLAHTAERGLFSFLALDERYWLRDDPGSASAVDPAGSNDAVTMLAAVAAVTTSIGLAVAAAPDYDDPADLVHRIASLDRLSGGRAAWHTLADGAGGVARSGAAGGPDEEGIASADGRGGLLDSARRTWQAPEPRDTGRTPVETLGVFEHAGHMYSLGLGKLDGPARRAGPVVLHDGGSPRELDFAARHADVVISAPATLEDALALRRGTVARSVDVGRGANDVKIFQSATFILAATDVEARQKAEAMRAQLPEGAWDNAAFIGSPAKVAARLLDFARTGAVDGFTLMPWMFPDELADIVNHLVPELQRRGIYPARYSADTLRGNLGLPETASSEDRAATHTLPVVEADDLGDVRLDLNLRMELVVAKMPA